MLADIILAYSTKVYFRTYNTDHIVQMPLFMKVLVTSC